MGRLLVIGIASISYVTACLIVVMLIHSVATSVYERVLSDVHCIVNEVCDDDR